MPLIALVMTAALFTLAAPTSARAASSCGSSEPTAPGCTQR